LLGMCIFGVAPGHWGPAIGLGPVGAHGGPIGPVTM
jgi:hypothetical protein